MSYNKKTWAKANKITSADLNRMEDGIAASDTAVSDLQTRTTNAEAAITDLQTETGDLGSYFVPANRVTTGGVVNLPIKHGELFICDNTLYRWRAPDRSGTGTYSFLASQVMAVTMSTYDVGSGSGSHVEGYYGNTSGGNTATGAYSHAEGMSATASGYASHAEGRLSEASAESSHAEGSATLATSDGSHAEGGSTQATGENSHAEGASTQATGTGSHAEGGTTRATGNYAHAEGTNNATASAMASHAEGGSTTASGNYSHAEGYGTIANHKSQHVFGEYNAEDGSSAANTARGDYIEIVGRGNGPTTRANARTLDWSGNEELAGDLTINKGQTGEKKISTAINALEAHFPATGKFVVGTGSATIGYAVAEGGNTVAEGLYSHAEGYNSRTSGSSAHAEGGGTVASGNYSHAEGGSTTASGDASHAEGNNTIAKNKSQHVFGEYNVEDPSTRGKGYRGTYVEIVGNGTTGPIKRSNARTLDWSGNEYLAGSLKLDTITLNPHYNRSEEKTLSLVNCKKLRLSWSVEDGGEATDYEVEVTAENITALLALLTTFGGISSPLSDTESAQARTLISRYSGITNPLTASEITQLRALISGGGSGGGEEEPPAVVVDPDEPGTEDPYEEPPA